MATIKNIDGSDIVNTTGVTELNENFTELNDNKLKRVEFQNNSTEFITLQDKIVAYRPWTWNISSLAGNLK